jgi:MIP family channel proteins
MRAPSRTDQGWARHLALLVGLTAAAAWLDVLTWMHLGKVFSSFMSGNLLLIGVATGDRNGDLLAHAAVALAAFLIGSAVGGLLTGSRISPRAALPMDRTLLLEAAVLGAFAVVWIAGGGPAGHPALSFALIAIGATAMGLQAAVAIAWHVPNVATVAMTATLVQAAALAGWRRREGPRAGVPGTPPASLMIPLILAYLVTAVLVASVSESAAMAFGPMLLVLAALGMNARRRRGRRGVRGDRSRIAISRIGPRDWPIAPRIVRSVARRPPSRSWSLVNSPSARDAGVAPFGRPAAYAAELIGTFGLVLFIVLVLTDSAAPPFGIGGPNFAVVGLVHAFALMLLIAALGGVCGAHFNPAVTVGLLSTRRIGFVDACAYIVMQVGGAVLAVLLVKALMDGSGSAAHFGAPAVATGRFLDGSAVKGLVAEGVGTFFLMWAIMGTVVNPRGDRSWGALVIGATLGLAVMCIAPLTGAGLNPARAFGPALFGGFGPAGDWLLAYVVGPVAGAVLAANLYTCLL